MNKEKKYGLSNPLRYWDKTPKSGACADISKSNWNGLAAADLRTLGSDLITHSVMLSHICFYSRMNKTCALAQLTFKHGYIYVLAFEDFRIGRKNPEEKHIMTDHSKQKIWTYKKPSPRECPCW